VEKDLLPITGKAITGVISKVTPSLNKGSMGIFLTKPIHIHLGNNFRDQHILEHGQGKSTFLSALS
jgi:hypothetical protein